MDEYPQWLAPQFEHDVSLRNRWIEFRRPSRKRHPLHPNAYEALDGQYWPGILECEEAAWHGTPVESRAPLLDFRVQRFLLRVPAVPLCVDKELLRRAFVGLLPDEIRLRPKTPLAGDPLVLQLKNGSWVPSVNTPAGKIGRFVDWSRLTVGLRNDSISSRSSYLRPISLHYWLKGVEKSSGIQ
jgi:asparagine synthase (glutamine-hydrolysing)